MVVEKLLKQTIVAALDRIWSESGVTPSKKTRRSIIRAAEKISNDVQQDFVMAEADMPYSEQPQVLTQGKRRQSVASGMSRRSR